MMPLEEPLPNKRFFRVDEVAKITGFAKSTIRKWARLELIEHKHFGGVIAIPNWQVVKMCEEGIPKRSEK
jgi:hypothetical protein